MSIERRMDKKLDRKLLEASEESLNDEAEKMINYDRIGKESKMKFEYSEESGLYRYSSGFRGFGIDVGKIKNMDVERRLEEIVKERKVTNLIEEKISLKGGLVLVAWLGMAVMAVLN